MAVPENYRLLKLKTGEDVIAECIQSPEDKNHIILHRPMQIQVAMGFDREGKPVPSRLIMTEWLAFSQEDSVVLPRENILAFGKPTEEITGAYIGEKLRIDQLRANMKLQPINPLGPNKADEQIAAAKKKAEQRKINKKKKMILIQMNVETLMKILESLGVDLDDEPWKSMVNPPDDDDEDEETEDDDEEEKPKNLDGSLDLSPDVDGDGLVDPYGNRWPDVDPKSN